MVDDEPDPQNSRTLHERLIAGDDRATAEIATAIFPWLCRRMAQINPHCHDPHLLDTASVEALTSYFKNPDTYDPTKLSLAKYLLMAAKGDLRNAIEREARIANQAAELEKKLVELPPPTAEHLRNSDLLEEQARPFLPDPVDQRIFSLMTDGIRDTDAYAAVLGIEDAPVSERQQKVKACKDRIIKRLKDANRRGQLRFPSTLPDHE